MHTTSAIFLGMSLFVVISSDRLSDATERCPPCSSRHEVIELTERLLSHSSGTDLPQAAQQDLRALVGQLRSDPAPDPSADWWRCQQLKLCLAEFSPPPSQVATRAKAPQATLWQVSIGRGFLRETASITLPPRQHLPDPGTSKRPAPRSVAVLMLDRWEQELLDQLASELCGRLAKP